MKSQKTILGLWLVFVLSEPARGLTLDETPANPGTWGYRPAEGTVCEINPPGFSWRPSGDAESYELQVGADPDFRNLLYSREDVPWSAHCPSQTLLETKCYWRYRAVDASGEHTDWSQVRAFEVKEGATQCPQPALADLLGRISEDHPRLFFRSEDLPSLKGLAEGQLSGRWKELQKAADKLLENPPDTSEPPLYPEGTTRLSGEWKEIWWGNRRRTIAVVDGAATLGFVYRMTGDEKYAEGARDLLMAFAEWDPEGSTNYEYNDEAAMPALYMPSRAYTWAYPALSDSDRAKIVAVMRTRGRHCYEHLRSRNHLWTPYASHSNRAWHFLGEVAIAFHDEIPEAHEWLDYAMTVLHTTYPVWGDDQGGWHEGISYWRSYISRFLFFSLVLDSAFDIDVFQRPFFQRTGYYAVYCMPPGSMTGGFGDLSPHATYPENGRVLAKLAAGSGNPYWKWYAEETEASFEEGYLGFLFAAKDRDLEAKPPTDLPSSACFRGVGLAFLNTDLPDASKNVAVHFKSSPMGRQSHGYNANNAFLLNLRGKRALVTSGRRDVHGSPHHRNWMWESKSDNAIQVNGEGQIKHDPEATGRITEFFTTPTVDVVVGEASESYRNLDRWTRRLIFLKPHALLIHDILDAPSPSTFEWNLHAEAAFKIGGDWVSWSGENGSLDIRFLEPTGLNISQTNQFDPPPHEWANFKLDEWHLSVVPPEKAAHQEFLTLITVDDAQVEVAEQAAGEGRKELGITLPEGEVKVSLSRERFSVEGLGVEREFE